MIKEGQMLPNGVLRTLVGNELVEYQVSSLFANKRVVLFGIPAAFSPICSEQHLAGYLEYSEALKQKGVDLIVCVGVNDTRVMKAFREVENVKDILMLSDGDLTYTKKLGLEHDTGAFGGWRSKRYSMLIEDNIVTMLNVEKPNMIDVSKVEIILSELSVMCLDIS